MSAISHPLRIMTARIRRRGSWLQLARSCKGANKSLDGLSLGIENRRRISEAIKCGPDLEFFINEANKMLSKKIMPTIEESQSYINTSDCLGTGLTVKFITYGCQMNVNDVELVRALLLSKGYTETSDEKKADVVLLMTCAVREGAEDKVWRELKFLESVRSGHGVVGVIGCMAERIRHQILVRAKNVSVVAGPDAYRDLPRLLAIARLGSPAINVQLSLDETYAEIAPVRANPSSKSAFVSIMRGCDNMCTYCVVPFTRGRERSRPMSSILDEIRRLSNEGIKQVTLLGQNVNSYRDLSEMSTSSAGVGIAPGFKTKYKPRIGGHIFVTLLDQASRIDPDIRIRFTSPHPKDFPIEVLELIKDRHNICNQIHLPAQSGSNDMLRAMDRGYSRESYMDLVKRIRSVIKGVSLTSDFIAGFCGETEVAHNESLDLIQTVQYAFCYVYPYSQRERTKAFHRLVDDVPPEVKKKRHQELATVFRQEALQHNLRLIGSIQLVLLEEESKRSSSDLRGWSDGGISVIINKILDNSSGKIELKPGDYVAVRVTSANSQTLHGEVLEKTTLKQFNHTNPSKN